MTMVFSPSTKGTASIDHSVLLLPGADKVAMPLDPCAETHVTRVTVRSSLAKPLNLYVFDDAGAGAPPEASAITSVGSVASDRDSATSRVTALGSSTVVPPPHAVIRKQAATMGSNRNAEVRRVMLNDSL